MFCEIQFLRTNNAFKIERFRYSLGSYKEAYFQM